MESELQSLEDKIRQFVTLCERLRDDNHHLRQKLAAALNDNQQLSEKIGSAKTRLEHLLTRIPENET